MTARKSATQAKMDGTFRADRHVDPVVLAPGRVVAPDSLDEHAMGMWNRYIAPRLELGIYEPAEAVILGWWCVLAARLLRVNELVPFEGMYEVEDDLGRTHWVKHPGMSVLKSLAEEFRATSQRLGLDTLSRMQLADLQQDRDGVGPNLPSNAPPAWTPQLVQSDATPKRALKPRCSQHARKWRKTCDECQQVRSREA